MQKKLHILLIVCVVLIGLALIKLANKPKTYTLEQEMQAVSLLPQNYIASDVDKIEIYASESRDKAVILQKGKNGWTIQNVSAPANSEKVNQFFNHLALLYGELRSTGKEFLSEFQLEEKQALHIQLYKDSNTPLFHFLVGKQEDSAYSPYNPQKTEACFVRVLDEDKIYRVGMDWRKNVGVMSESGIPEYLHWLEKKLVSCKKEQIRSVCIEYPDKKILAEWKARDQKQALVPEENAFMQSNKSSQEEWQITTGAMAGQTLNDYEWKNLLENFCTLEGDDVASQQTKETWKNLFPSYSIEVTLQDNSKQKLYAYSNVTENDAYCYLAENTELLYKISKWKFNGIFKRGSNLFTLASYRPDKTQVKGLRVTTPDGSVTIHRVLLENDPTKKESDKTSWVLESPKEIFSVEREIAEGIMSQLQTFRMDDYSDETDLSKVGLQNPEYSITLLMKDDSTRTIYFGSLSTHIDGRYAILDNQQPVGVVEKSEFEKLCPSLNQLFQLTLIRDDCTQFTLNKAGETFSLQNQAGVWQWETSQDKGTADSSKVASLVALFKNFTPKKVSFTYRHVKTPLATFLTKSEKNLYNLAIYPKEKEGYPVVVDPWQACFWIAEDTGDLLMQPASYYQIPPAVEKKSDSVLEQSNATSEEVKPISEEVKPASELEQSSKNE